MIKAIETVYNGYRFRSRLEARWAVFFDTLGIEYQYEPEGFDLGEAGWYLPDFWLPHQVELFAEKGWGMWVEIKPRLAGEQAMTKIITLVEQSKHNALIFQGSPWQDEYNVTKVSGTHFIPPYIWLNLAFGTDQYSNICLTSRGTKYTFTSYPSVVGSESELVTAYTTARQARFERGAR